MTELAGGEDHWWAQEPPEDEERLPYDFEGNKSLSAVERLDGMAEHRLFEGVRVSEVGNSVRFDVPPRLIETPKHGLWQLRVYGTSKWFKEPDDYGYIRFLSDGQAIWVPHLYPFELPLDKNNLPLIRDRQRCELTVELEPYAGGEDDTTGCVMVRVPGGGEYVASEAPESYNPDGILYFTEFACEAQALVMRMVTFPPLKWPSYGEYQTEHPDAISLGDALSSGQDLPGEYRGQFEPNAWADRDVVRPQSSAFGSIWVPVDALRFGSLDDVMINFPMFRP